MFLCVAVSCCLFTSLPVPAHFFFSVFFCVYCLTRITPLIAFYLPVLVPLSLVCFSGFSYVFFPLRLSSSFALGPSPSVPSLPRFVFLLCLRHHHHRLIVRSSVECMRRMPGKNEPPPTAKQTKQRQMENTLTTASTCPLQRMRPSAFSRSS